MELRYTEMDFVQVFQEKSVQNYSTII